MTRKNSPLEKITALRAKLEEQGLDGFLIPLADENQGEYVPGYAQRLSWLTGFTGSAGLAIVLKDKAAIFVDGRYTLQVENEADGSLYEFLSFVQDKEGNWPPIAWIKKNLGRMGRLGFDPWLHSESQMQRFKKSCQDLDGELVSCKTNPVDAIWRDQPDRPLAPVAIHPLKFTGEESASKLKGIAQKLEEKGNDAAVLTDPASIAWLFNIRGGDIPYSPMALGFALVHRSGKADLFMDGEKVSTEVAQHLGPNVALNARQNLGKILEKLGIDAKKIVVSKQETPFWIVEKIKAAGARAIYGEDPCALPKACKNETEVAGMRAAHLRDGVAMVKFMAWLEQASSTQVLTEMSVADKLEGFRRENEYFQGLSFPTISGAGPNGAIVHYRVDEKSNRTLEKGTLYLVDSGAQYLDGTTDVTRTVAIGKPSPEMKDRFTRVLKGHVALSSAIFPEGTTGSQLDSLARGPLWQIGLDYDHGTGHGVGCYLSVHEGPQRISKLPNRVALRPGMIISNEPGYYKTGAYGIRIENLVVVAPCQHLEESDRKMLRFDPLTLVPLDTDLIEMKLLEKSEVEWIDTYHREVFDRLSPMIEGKTRAWLKENTKPLPS